MADRWMTVKETARYLGVSTWWLWWHRKHNDGPAFHSFSKRKIKYRQDDVDAWRNSRGSNLIQSIQAETSLRN